MAVAKGPTKLQLLAEQPAPALLTAIEAEQARLWSLLAGQTGPAVTERPANGDWSVVENVRHLLFVEQGHFIAFIPGEPDWSPLAMRPASPSIRKRLKMDEGTPTDDLAQVLMAWQDVHRENKPYLDGDGPALRRALAVNLRHLRGHTAIIEKLLRAHARKSTSRT